MDTYVSHSLIYEGQKCQPEQAGGRVQSSLVGRMLNDYAWSPGFESQYHIRVGIVFHAYNHSPWEAKAGKSLWIPGQSGLQSTI